MKLKTDTNNLIQITTMFLSYSVIPVYLLRLLIFIRSLENNPLLPPPPPLLPSFFIEGRLIFPLETDILVKLKFGGFDNTLLIEGYKKASLILSISVMRFDQS